ncbi:MAG TPA: SRPBCC family protein [Gammaproteobacteria bacterium]
MKRLMTAFVALASAACLDTALAEPEYVTIEMEIDIAKPAEEVWEKVGGYCDISEWLDVDCTIVSGDGGIGTVRSLAGGRITEVLVGLTDLSYGYTQPVREGRFYDLYHGYMEAKPVTETTSKLLYTLMYDVSDKPDQAAKDADIARRRAMFEAALRRMKEIAEAGPSESR